MEQETHQEIKYLNVTYLPCDCDCM